MNKYNEYIRYYSEGNEYKTDPQKFPKKSFATLRFYIDELRIVLYSNRFARHGEYNDVRWSNSSVDIVRCLEKVGVQMHFEGMANFNKIDGPVIFVANHMSTMETMAIPCMIQPNKPCLYVIKQQLATYPLFGTLAVARSPILVGRENPREDLKIVMEEGAKRIALGKSIIIFPQRTRADLFDPSLFNSLGVKLAKKNNIPVVPLALLTDAWGNGKIVKEFGKIDNSKKVYFSYGEPMYIKGNGTEEHQYCVDFIKNKLISWGRGDLIKNSNNDSLT